MSRLVELLGQVKSLKNGIGVQNLLDAAYQIMGNPIAMFNTEYNLRAYTEVVTDDPIWNALITHGTFSKEMQQFFETEGFIEEAANAPVVALMHSDKLKYDRMGGKLFYKNDTYVSNLVIVACNKPFAQEDAEIFEAVCKLISREISRDALYQEYGQAHQETIIRNLLDGTCDIKLDMGQVGILYDTLKSSLYVAVAYSPACAAAHSDITHLRDLLMQTEPTYKYAIYADYIVIILSTDDEILHVEKAFRPLMDAFKRHHIYVGISSPFENLFELHKYYGEALQMMQYALDRKSGQRIFPYNRSAADTMRRIETLENGLGIQYFLNMAQEIFGNPLLFHDMELNLLGYTENMEISDPIWEELITYGTSSDETIKLFKTEGFINTMENTKGGAVLISDKIKYDRISWRIYSNDSIMIGCLSIVNTMRPFREDELVIFGAFSQKFSKEVGKIEFYNNYGRVYSETVINRLISGKIDDYTFYSEDIGNLYDHLMENIYLVVVDTAQCGNEQVNLNYFRELFNRPDTVNRYAIHASYIVVIISTDSVSLNENHEMDEMDKVFRQNNIYAGISSCFGNIYDSQKHYNEAVDALISGMNGKGENGRQRIFQYR